MTILRKKMIRGFGKTTPANISISSIILKEALAYRGYSRFNMHKGGALHEVRFCNV